MKNLLAALLAVCSIGVSAQQYQTVFEQSNGRQTPTYGAIIDFYRQLDKASPTVLLQEGGMTDAGFPLHLVLFSNDGRFDPAAWHKQNKVVLMVNNGIHPGEPDGIDASMLLVRDLVTGKKTIPDNVALAFIPVYNIGGCLNRSSNYRVNQNGPEASGFRGNSQNLDLNRDFIKCDSREARAFTTFFHYLDPDVFIDNHVSDGADYQHIMTLISSQHSKLGGTMGEFMQQQFEPGLYALMKAKGYDLVPYVNYFGTSPDNGWPEFFDSPRYSSGYATLWNTFGFTTETHMLKPYDKRVLSTYALMESFIDFASRNNARITSLRRQARESVVRQSSFPVSWKLDSSRFSMITFKGYQAMKKPSAVSGLPRLYYDHNQPFEKKVKLFNEYTPVVEIRKPRAYVIPQGWWKVAELLKLNKVQLLPLKRDTSINVEEIHIANYLSTARQYEMHHPNNGVTINVNTRVRTFRKGDYLVYMNQPANRFITEVLEPQSNDSYFAWNFFDAILVPKEGFSDYVFEDTAEALLKRYPDIQTRLVQRKAADTAFARSASAQLEFVFRNSPYFEPEYLSYPVFRIP